MSAQSPDTLTASEMAHAHPNPHAHGDGHDHGTRRTYLIGFALSVILTAIPFWLVMGDVIADRTIATLLIMAFGVAQIFVHMVYFLHMNTKSEGGWTMMAAIFTIIVIVIALSGSLWVMFHLNTNMMPGHTMNPADMI
ncbi:cytochrome o ubiquinol oxidase subunit IV [Devosia sp. BK]|jgi:cytochrome o ubiquinol oxidase operon protein cyoD|uniref:cytochrome o ubiquinol oxidase subunit IV n=1 Tax=unclassified Devosia TaxID=196773 RepID=UPI000AD1593C|nr:MULTISPECIES: cytochrome o ubiquinol oxidase subunit IV [unclassified Devosia]MDV3253341.1 cytochrome o ubiquinol oxidase subunit IV [Devosia sp. BK]